jgi:spore germination protein KC
MKKWKAAVIALICTSAVTGCWDKKELNDVAVVMGVGIDKEKNNQYLLTAQVIKPSPPQKGGSGGSELPTWSLSASGISVMDAISEMNRISPRRLYWPHLQIIIFGEKLAKEGMAPVLTWFERDRDSRAGTYVAVTKGTAEDLLNQKIELGNIPAKVMADLIDNSFLRQITTRKTTLRNLVSILTMEGVDATVDVIEPKEIRGKQETYDLHDSAVFHEDKLVGYLGAEDSNAIEIVTGKYKNAIMNIACPDNEKESMAYVVTDFRRDKSFIQTDEGYGLKLHLFIEGNLGDQTCMIQLSDPKQRRQVELAIAAKVKDMIQNAFAKSAGWHSDIYGIGKEFRRVNPKKWHQVEAVWDDELLAKSIFKITVDASIRRTGLLLRTTGEKIK